MIINKDVQIVYKYYFVWQIQKWAQILNELLKVLKHVNFFLYSVRHFENIYLNTAHFCMR